LVLRGGDTNDKVSISSPSNNSAVREMSSGNKEEAKVMEAVTKVKKSNAFDVIVAAVTEERSRCHMIDVLAIGLFVQMMMEVPSVTKLCKQRILNLIYFAVEYDGDGMMLYR